MSRERKSIVRVTYKTGTQVDITCSEFEVTRNKVNGNLAVKWSADASPYPLMFGVDDVESIYHVNPRPDRAVT